MNEYLEIILVHSVRQVIDEGQVIGKLSGGFDALRMSEVEGCVPEGDREV